VTPQPEREALLAEIQQMACAAHDQYSAGAWCEATNDLLGIVEQLTRERDEAQGGWDNCAELLEVSGADYQRERDRAEQAERERDRAIWVGETNDKTYLEMRAHFDQRIEQAEQREAESRERIRQMMVETPCTEARDTFKDGFHDGLHWVLYQVLSEQTKPE